MSETFREDKSKVAVLLVFLVISVFYLSTIRGGHDWGGDFAQYFEHARNIADGNPYTQTTYIKNPHRSLAPDAYPPGLPMLISVIYAVDGFNLTAIKVMSCLFFFASLVIFYFVYNNRMSGYYLAVVIALIAFYPRFWEYKDMTFSELPFMFFSFLALFLSEKTFEKKEQKNWILVLNYTAIFLLLVAAISTRVVGGILIPVLGIYFIKKIGKIKIFLIICLVGLGVTLISFFVFNEMLRGLLTYFDIINFGPKMVLSNAFSYLKMFSHFWNNYNPLIINKIFSFLLMLLALFGFYTSCRKEITIYDMFFVFYLGFLLTIPWPLNRFLLPLYPFWVFYTVVGINRFFNFRIPHINWGIKAVILVFIVQIFYVKFTEYDFDMIRPGISTEGAKELFAYIDEKTDESSIIVFRKPRVISLLKKRKSLVYYPAPTYEALGKYLNEQGVTHLIIGTFYDDYDYIVGFYEAYKDCFRMDLKNSEFSVFKVVAPF